MKNIKNVTISNISKSHKGSEGYWLEKQMKLSHNSKNQPDMLGFEMKKESKKITFGDFSASEYLFSMNKPTIDTHNETTISISKDHYIRLFGHKNVKKNNRYSWSGVCVPKYDEWNDYGQMMKFNENNDLCIYYDYSKDKRDDRYETLKTPILIAFWKAEKLTKHINNKFNQNGFFICKKYNRHYNRICFGKPFTFDYFVENIKNRNIIFDSGMYTGNTRNYSMFRSCNQFWNQLITEEYKNEIIEMEIKKEN